MSEKQLPGETLTHAPQMSLRDYFATHADISDVLLAESDIVDELGAAAIDHDALTIRARARFRVAERMIRVRGES